MDTLDIVDILEPMAQADIHDSPEFHDLVVRTVLLVRVVFPDTLVSMG